MSYDELDIHQGDQASREYVQVVFGGADAARREKVFANLRRYCEQDTLAMVELLKVIEELAH